MSVIETNDDAGSILLKRYSRWSKVILFIAVIYFLWVLFVITSVYFLDMGYRWSGLSITEWTYAGIFILIFLIVLEIIFFIHYLSATKWKAEKEKEQSKYFKGKRLHTYTLPIDSKGGIFSKTYVKIDEKNILNLRYQIISSEELWGNEN